LWLERVINTSATGMLLYLANHTRPDVLFVVAQCETKHKQALECIRVSRGSMDKGLVLRPDTNQPLDIGCYIDADLVDSMAMNNHTTPQVLRSQSGFCSMCV
jgi:hypothetical protein